MEAIKWLAVAAFLSFAVETEPVVEPLDEPTTMDSPEELMKAMVGSWEGTSRVWLTPGKLGDVSKTKGRIEPMLGGRFVRHTYEGSMRGKPRTGEETIVFNAPEQKWQVSWFDTFHMSTGLLFSEGKTIKGGFAVTGHWALGPKQKPWGWRTEYTMADADHLTITAFNITPDGREAKGVETVYVRTKPEK